MLFGFFDGFFFSFFLIFVGMAFLVGWIARSVRDSPRKAITWAKHFFTLLHEQLDRR